MMKNKQVFLISDIHGDYKPIRDFANFLTKEDIEQYDNYLIILGDAGCLYFLDENNRDNELKTTLGKYPFTYFIMRGNHEQRPSEVMKNYPDKWHIEDFWNNKVYVENKYPYIKYALDCGGEYNIFGHSTLILPGAYSVDKEYRLLRGWNWFPREQMTEDEKQDIITNLKPHYDYILAHTCLISFEPFISDLFMNAIDPNKSR